MEAPGLSRLVLAFLALVPAFASAQSHGLSRYDVVQVDRRKTVCSITINSDDEIRTFKDKMDPSNFKFVELVADADDPGWFDAACRKMEQEVKAGRSGCDVLVVSGHFGGVFFGESNASLDIDELDRRACDRSCDAILKNPKEVFLMGCNTLANKERDKRQDDEYLKILVADGVPREFAERVVAYRYGEVGYSLEQRMSAIFSDSARIYGFASTGPVGAKAAPALRNYFAKKKNYSTHLDSMDASTNSDLQKSFSSTSFTQTRGNPSFSHNYYNESCGLLAGDATGRVRKVDELITSGRFFAHADKAVAALLEAQKISDGKVPDAATLARWRSNAAFMKRLKDIPGASPSLHEIRSDLRYMQDLVEQGAKSPLIAANQAQILKNVLAKPLNFISKDQVCAIAKKHPEVTLSASMLPPEKVWNSFTVEAMGCFSSLSPDLSKRLVDISLGRAGGAPAWLVDSTERFLAKRLDLPSSSQESIFTAALGEKNPSKRAERLRSLASLENPPNWPNLIGAIGKDLGAEEKDALASALAQRLRYTKSPASFDTAAYLNPLLKSQDPVQQEIGLRALRKAHASDARKLLGGTFTDPSWVLPENATLYAQTLRILDASSEEKEKFSEALSARFPSSGASHAVFDPVKDAKTERKPAADQAAQVWDELKQRIATIKPSECLEASFRMGATKAGDDARWWCLEQAKIKPTQTECFGIAAEMRGESRPGAYWACLKTSRANLSPELCDSAAQSLADARQGDDLRWNCLETLKSLKVLDEASCLRLAEGMSLRGQRIRANWNCLDHFNRR
jgi:hypothetical protein